MIDFIEGAERIISAYNDKDFSTLRSLMVADIDFAHFNRDFALKGVDELITVMEQFAHSFLPDRRIGPADRITLSGNIVVREAFYTGTAQVDLPGFAAKGGNVRLKFCSVLRFDDRGVLLEWKDYG